MFLTRTAFLSVELHSAKSAKSASGSAGLEAKCKISSSSAVNKNNAGCCTWIGLNKLTFSNGQLAFKGKSYLDLLRSYFVLRMCCIDLFANNAYKVFTTLQRCLGSTLFTFIFKPTVYRNFIAGSSKNEILSTAASLSKSGLMPLISPMLEDGPEIGGFSEQKYNRNLNIIRESLDICSSLESPGGPKCFAIKLSAIIPAQLLKDLSLALGADEKISADQVLEISAALRTGKVNISSLKLTPQGLERLRNSRENIMLIGSECESKNVSVYIDAEYTVYQPGVRLIVLALMHIFNRDHHTVWNTYQCYLKKTEQQIYDDTALITSLGARWAGKMVRGAYMEFERTNALENKVSDPIHSSLENTAAAYNRVSDYLLERISSTENWRCIFATHNLESILLICHHQKSIYCKDKIYFGQIAGMAEGISCGLAQTGFNVYKLVPTGSVDEVLPWLSRRMAENRGIMAGAKHDRLMIYEELCRRNKEAWNIRKYL